MTDHIEVRTPLFPDYFHNYASSINFNSKRDLEKSRFYMRYMNIPFDTIISRLMDPNQPPPKPSPFTCCAINQSFDKTMHTLESLDLILSVEDFKNIYKIELDIGGQRFDVQYMDDAYCNFLENTYERRLEYLPNNKVKIPLLFCGLQGDSYLLLSEKTYHSIKIVIQSTNIDTRILPKNVQLWGEVRTLETNVYQELLETGTCMVTQQTQYSGPELVNHKQNKTYKIRLNFNHLAYCLYFHLGKEHKQLVPYLKNVKLEFEDMVFYNGPCELLHNENSYCAIHFKKGSPIFDKVTDNGLWNFSCINMACLILDFEGIPEEKEVMIYTFLHSYQILKYQNGMFGLMFSK